jgi:type IV pilus assembly protein PilC
MFEMMFTKITEQIREGESIAKPMKEFSRCKFQPFAAFFWFFIPPVIGLLLYLTKMNAKIVDDLVVNMVDVGEETGALDSMLYKIADVYDEEVSVLVEGLINLLEPIMVVILGLIVGFIVIALFMPLIKLLNSLS